MEKFIQKHDIQKNFNDFEKEFLNSRILNRPTNKYKIEDIKSNDYINYIIKNRVNKLYYSIIDVLLSVYPNVNKFFSYTRIDKNIFFHHEVKNIGNTIKECVKKCIIFTEEDEVINSFKKIYYSKIKYNCNGIYFNESDIIDFQNQPFILIMLILNIFNVIDFSDKEIMLLYILSMYHGCFLHKELLDDMLSLEKKLEMLIKSKIFSPINGSDAITNLPLVIHYRINSFMILIDKNNYLKN